MLYVLCFFFFKQKTAYEMRISDWSSDVCSSDLGRERWQRAYMDFYDTLIGGCKSPLLIDYYSDLVARAERYINLFADQSIDPVRDHAAEHSAIVDAVLGRDAVHLNKQPDESTEHSKNMGTSNIDTHRQSKEVTNKHTVGHN